MDGQEIKELPRIALRAAEAHKGNFGRVLIVAGSDLMPGAAILCSRAALRSGAGLVTAAVPETIAPAVAAAVPEATQVHYDARDQGTSVATLEAAIGSTQFSAVAVGPGLGVSAVSSAVVTSMLTNAACPQVVDADAVNIVAASGQTPPARRPDRVWTPHPGEFSRLTGEQPHTDDERRRSAVDAATRFGGVMLLKGHGSVIATQDSYALNLTGNPGMATAGSGDVLTGIVAGLLAQGYPPFDAARLAAHLHGKAGDLARRLVGELGLIASDLIEALPSAIVEHQKETGP